MTARIHSLALLLFTLALAGCDQSSDQAVTDDYTPPAEDVVIGDEAGGYNFFTIQEIRNAAKLRLQAMQGSGAYEILDGLTTEAGGRLAGSKGDARAVAYMEKTFTELGFDKVWKEPVTIQGWARTSAAAEILGHGELDLNIVSLGRSASTPEGGVTAELVRFDTYQELVDADAATVEGKIVYISNKMERAKDGAGYGPAVIARSRGHAEVAKKGGLALLIRSIGTDDSDFPHTGAMSFRADGPNDIFEPAKDGAAWSIAFGEKTVAAAALSNQDADALDALLADGQALSVHVDIQNTFLGEVTSYNVIAELTGTTRPDEIVLVGGHLDSWDLATGAMDDGMGVAITTAAANLIRKLPERPERTIRVVAWAGEETGLWGAFAYAAAHGGDDHVFAMESDFGIGRVWRLNPNVATENIPVIREMWRLLGPMGIEWAPDKTGLDSADLYPLDLQKAQPGAALYGDGTYYFDYHHTARDTMDIIKAEDLDFNTAGYAIIIYLAAQYDGRFGAPPKPEDE